MRTRALSPSHSCFKEARPGRECDPGAEAAPVIKVICKVICIPQDRQDSEVWAALQELVYLGSSLERAFFIPSMQDNRVRLDRIIPPSCFFFKLAFAVRS